MTSNFQKVLEFHEKFEVENKPSPQFPNRKTVNLRVALIREEFKELRDAIKEKDLVEVADALTDILYVVYGAGLAFGIDLDACFDEIHRSNMTKLGADGKPVRREDGKVIKGPNYESPNLRKVLNL